MYLMYSVLVVRFGSLEGTKTMRLACYFLPSVPSVFGPAINFSFFISCNRNKEIVGKQVDDIFVSFCQFIWVSM